MSSPEPPPPLPVPPELQAPAPPEPLPPPAPPAPSTAGAWVGIWVTTYGGATAVFGSFAVAGAVLMGGITELIVTEHDLAVARGRDDPMFTNMLDGQMQILEQTRVPSLVDGGFALLAGILLVAAGVGICRRSGFWRRTALVLLALKLAAVGVFTVYAMGWYVPQLLEYYEMAEDTIQRGGGQVSFARLMEQWTWFSVVVTALVAAAMAGVTWLLVKMRSTRTWCSPPA